MKINKLYNCIFIITAIIIAQQALASEYQGSLNTGLGTNLQGTVGQPTTTVPSLPGGSSGGGGGGGGGATLISNNSGNKKMGDADGDNKADIKDFNILMVNWGKNGTSILGDLNNDGKVDILDFNILMVNWGK